MAGSSAIFLGRACGLAAGTLLACGSVLAGATHVGDGSLAQGSAPPHSPTLTAPDATAGSPAVYRADPPAGPASAAPGVVSVQAVSEPIPSLHPQLGPVRRNAPVSVPMPAEEPVENPGAAQQPWRSPPPANGPAAQNPVPPVSPAPVSPVLDPAAKGEGRVTPVGGEVLAPNNPNTLTNLSTTANPRQIRADSREKQAGSRRDGRSAGPRDKRTSLVTRGAVGTVKKVVAPVGNTVSQPVEPVKQATRPAMAMLTSVLPIG